MEVSGTQTSFLFKSPFTISGGDAAAVQEARNTLNTGGEPRTSNRDIVFNALISATRQVPAIEAAGPLAGFRVSDAIQFLSKRVGSNKFPIVDDLERKGRFTNLKIDRLSQLRESLKTLNTTVNVFLNNGAFNLRAAESPSGGRVQVEPGSIAPTARFTVTPARKVVNSALASDEQSEPLGSLGLSGSFFVNGFKITVETTDSIFELRDKINRGEDLNNNGVLDNAEDFNNNGLIDIIVFLPSESGPGIFITEDLNANGKLDPDEDVIDNDRLDGGTAESKVKASVIKNRLVLTSLAGGSTKIDLRDDDNILLALGFFELNIKGLPIQKELQFNDDRFAVNLNVLPQPALAKVDKTFADPETVENDFDEFDNIAEDTVVTLKKESQRKSKVRIFIDATTTLDQIQTFFDQFNTSIRQINKVLSQSREFAKDREIQDIRDDLTRKTQTKTSELERRNEKIDLLRIAKENRQGIGFSVNNTEKQAVQEVPATTTVEDILQGIISPFTNADKDLLNRLSSAGVRTLEDDTFVIDGTRLKRALKVNPVETLGLFNDPETGILPVLSEKLGQLLREDLGDLDLKRDQILIQSQTPNFLAEKHRQFTEVSTLSNAVQNLIAVA
ncbi:hypothetical protein UZ36_02405 [Candidatus Nitromaritima sp. SCGC AAA799-C22]|nr:hypothetical protein UZ36_02405 [Candidatus Nitromaritima sp. SCGC AAA799-C22]